MVDEKTRILVVEDDPDVAESLRNGLSRNGFDVVWKSLDADGVAYARDSEPHLVTLDVSLPDGSGFDFCRQMRQSRLRLPILMITARRDESDKVLGLEMGADDYT